MPLNKTAVTLDPEKDKCQNELNSLEEIKKEIEKYKGMYDQLLKDNKKLDKNNSETLELASDFHQRSENLKKLLQEDEEEHEQRKDNLKKRLTKLKTEECWLKEEEQGLKEEYCNTDQMDSHLRQQTQVSMAAPAKRVVFTGDVSNEGEAVNLQCEIVYPMEGGTAFITFKDEEVAQNILLMKKHEVALGNCRITLEAKPAVFLLPSLVEMSTHICPNRILVSNLPKNLKADDKSWLQDRLDVHFHKTRNGGGEVESVFVLEDSGDGVVVFVNDNVAQGLVDKEYHEVDLLKKKHKVRVTPFINGEMKTLQVTVSVSSRTVLLTGFLDVMEQDAMQDSLELHFQKTTNGGGEVDAIVFNPMGCHTFAIFRDNCPTAQ